MPSRRIQSRRGNGRYERGSLENTFGLSVVICPDCRACNPYRTLEPRPEVCEACGAPMIPGIALVAKIDAAPAAGGEGR